MIRRFKSVPVISQDKTVQNVRPRTRIVTTMTRYDMSSVYNHALDIVIPFAPGKRFGAAVGAAFAVVAISFIMFGRSDVGMSAVFTHKAFWIVLGVAAFLCFVLYDPTNSILWEQMNAVARKDRGLKDDEGSFECVTDEQWSAFVMRLTGSAAAKIICHDGQSVALVAAPPVEGKGGVYDEVLAEMRQEKMMASVANKGPAPDKPVPGTCPSCGMPLPLGGVRGLLASCQRCGQRFE